MGVGKTLHGRTLGLYGYGRIAKAVAGYADAFGMQVVWWSSDEGRERVRADGATVAKSRKEFFSEPDVVSIHVHLKPATREIITASDLAAMRDDALFVNTSRAGLIEKGGLAEGARCRPSGQGVGRCFLTKSQSRGRMIRWPIIQD